MKDDQAVLFVRINSVLKAKIDAAASEERRSTASMVEQILKKSFEVRNGKTNTKSNGQAGLSERKVL